MMRTEVEAGPSPPALTSDDDLSAAELTLKVGTAIFTAGPFTTRHELLQGCTVIGGRDSNVRFADRKRIVTSRGHADAVHHELLASQGLSAPATALLDVRRLPTGTITCCVTNLGSGSKTTHELQLGELTCRLELTSTSHAATAAAAATAATAAAASSTPVWHAHAAVRVTDGPVMEMDHGTQRLPPPDEEDPASGVVGHAHAHNSQARDATDGLPTGSIPDPRADPAGMYQQRQAALAWIDAADDDGDSVWDPSLQADLTTGSHPSCRPSQEQPSCKPSQEQPSCKPSQEQPLCRPSQEQPSYRPSQEQPTATPTIPPSPIELTPASTAAPNLAPQAGHTHEASPSLTPASLRMQDSDHAGGQESVPGSQDPVYAVSKGLMPAPSAGMPDSHMGHGSVPGSQEAAHVVSPSLTPASLHGLTPLATQTTPAASQTEAAAGLLQPVVAGRAEEPAFQLAEKPSSQGAVVVSQTVVSEPGNPDPSQGQLHAAAPCTQQKEQLRLAQAQQQQPAATLADTTDTWMPRRGRRGAASAAAAATAAAAADPSTAQPPTAAILSIPVPQPSQPHMLQPQTDAAAAAVRDPGAQAVQPGIPATELGPLAAQQPAVAAVPQRSLSLSRLLGTQSGGSSMAVSSRSPSPVVAAAQAAAVQASHSTLPHGAAADGSGQAAGQAAQQAGTAALAGSEPGSEGGWLTKQRRGVAAAAARAAAADAGPDAAADAAALQGPQAGAAATGPAGGPTSGAPGSVSWRLPMPRANEGQGNAGTPSLVGGRRLVSASPTGDAQAVVLPFCLADLEMVPDSYVESQAINSPPPQLRPTQTVKAPLSVQPGAGTSTALPPPSLPSSVPPTQALGATQWHAAAASPGQAEGASPAAPSTDPSVPPTDPPAPAISPPPPHPTLPCLSPTAHTADDVAEGQSEGQEAELGDAGEQPTDVPDTTASDQAPRAEQGHTNVTVVAGSQRDAPLLHPESQSRSLQRESQGMIPGLMTQVAADALGCLAVGSPAPSMQTARGAADLVAMHDDHDATVQDTYDHNPGTENMGKPARGKGQRGRGRGQGSRGSAKGAGRGEGRGAGARGRGAKGAGRGRGAGKRAAEADTAAPAPRSKRGRGASRTPSPSLRAQRDRTPVPEPPPAAEGAVTRRRAASRTPSPAPEHTPSSTPTPQEHYPPSHNPAPQPGALVGAHDGALQADLTPRTRRARERGSRRARDMTSAQLPFTPTKPEDAGDPAAGPAAGPVNDEAAATVPVVQAGVAGASSTPAGRAAVASQDALPSAGEAAAHANQVSVPAPAPIPAGTAQQMAQGTGTAMPVVPSTHNEAVGAGGQGSPCRLHDAPVRSAEQGVSRGPMPDADMHGVGMHGDPVHATDTHVDNMHGAEAHGSEAHSASQGSPEPATDSDNDVNAHPLISAIFGTTPDVLDAFYTRQRSNTPDHNNNTNSADRHVMQPALASGTAQPALTPQLAGSDQHGALPAAPASTARPKLLPKPAEDDCSSGRRAGCALAAAEPAGTESASAGGSAHADSHTAGAQSLPERAASGDVSLGGLANQGPESVAALFAYRETDNDTTHPAASAPSQLHPQGVTDTAGQVTAASGSAGVGGPQSTGGAYASTGGGGSVSVGLGVSEEQGGATAGRKRPRRVSDTAPAMAPHSVRGAGTGKQPRSVVKKEAPESAPRSQRASAARGGERRTSGRRTSAPLSLSPSPTPTLPTNQVRVQFSSQYSASDQKRFADMVRRLGGVVVAAGPDDPHDAAITHLLVPRAHFTRSAKQLQAIACGAAVVSETWLADSAANGAWAEVRQEHMGADANALRKWDFDLWRSYELRRQNGPVLQGVRVFLTPGLEAHLKRQKLNGKLDAIRSLVPLCQGTLLDRLPDTHATSMDTHQHADGAGLKQETSGVQDSPSHTQRKKRLKTASASAPAAASTQAIPGGGNVGVPVGGAHCGDVTGEVAAGTSGDVTATVAASGLLVVGCKDDNSRRAGIAPGTCVWGEETLIRSVLCSEKLWERPGEKPLFVSRQYG